MSSLLRNLVKGPTSSIVLNKNPLIRNYKGGVPGNNLPWRKGLANPIRFNAFFLLAGIIGFGAPWFIIMHQMLRPYDYVVD